MPEHKIGTREEWQAARDELAKLEAEQAERNAKIRERRLALPWVRVDKEYEFDTEDGKKTLAELFDGRSQLLAYNIMFGPDYSKGACPGCTSPRRRPRRVARPPQPPRRDPGLLLAGADRAAHGLQAADGLAVSLRVHLQHRLPVRLRARAERGAGAADPGDQADGRKIRPTWLVEWSHQIGAELKDGLRETPAWIVFARENGTVYHTYTVSAPDPFVAPYFTLLLDRTPRPEPDEPRTFRKDEYPD